MDPSAATSSAAASPAAASSPEPSARPTRWPLERILFALAGTMTLVSVVLALTVSPWFLVLTAFVGINQWLYVTASACPASVVLSRVGVRRTCRW